MAGKLRRSLPLGPWPAVDNPRQLTRRQQAKLHEIAWLMWREDYSYSQIAQVIGWQTSSAAVRAVQMHQRRIGERHG